MAIHVFLYGGITAYNSYYDRDEGPVGGLLRPPPVTQPLLGFSIGMQLIGLALSAAVGWELTLLYATVMLLSVAYSHPAFRWKARTAAVVAWWRSGKGASGFSRAGVLCAATPRCYPLHKLGGMACWPAAAVLLTTGFTP